MMAISPSFTPIMTERLLKRSAIQPPTVENSRKGTAKSKEACEAKSSFCASVKATETRTRKDDEPAQGVVG